MTDLRRVAVAKAKQYGVDPAVFTRQIQQESGFNPRAVSPAGARGVAQFIPSTAKQYGVNVNDPISSLDGAARLMRDALKRNGGDYKKALSEYNSGRPDGYLHISETRNYVNKILGGGAPVPSQRAPLSEPAAPPGADRSQLLQEYLQLRGRPGATLGLAEGLQALRPATPQAAAAPATSLAGAAGPGALKITGPNPGRIKPSVLEFGRAVSAIYGAPLVGSDGTGHSRLTVNGNVSQHTTGNATDIPATGAQLIRMGQAALEAAGMPRAQARKQKGGLFNVGGHQIIFNTHEGGDHTDHLHISAR